MSRPGLMVAFKREDGSHAKVRIKYYGAPETTVEYVIFVADGTAGQPVVKERNKNLKHGEKYEFSLERSASGVILVSAYSESASLIGNAVSASPSAGH